MDCHALLCGDTVSLLVLGGWTVCDVIRSGNWLFSSTRSLICTPAMVSSEQRVQFRFFANE